MLDHIGAITVTKRLAMDLRSSETMLIRTAIRICVRALYGGHCGILVITVKS
jgi:hypothetical protein